MAWGYALARVVVPPLSRREPRDKSLCRVARASRDPARYSRITAGDAAVWSKSTRVVIGRNLARSKCAGKVLICRLEVLSLDIVAAQSSASVERENHKSRGNATYLGISQAESSCTFQHLVAGRANQLGGSVRNLVVVCETGDEHYRRGQSVRVDRVGGPQLEEFLRAHFRKQGR